MKPVLLDLFCGAGGCTKGYQRAGFRVVGVDLHQQPNYCGDDFVQMDALEFLRRLLAGERVAGYVLEDFVAIHASPPCQFATDYIRTGRVKESPNLIPQTRELVRATGLPYVIENVARALYELVHPIMLCGSAFGLDVQRHRLFETNFSWLAPGCTHGWWQNDRFPGGRSKERTGSSRGLVRRTVEIGSWDTPLEVQQEAMGIDWMPVESLSQAIPPAYTEHIGGYLMAEINARAAA